MILAVVTGREASSGPSGPCDNGGTGQWGRHPVCGSFPHDRTAIRGTREGCDSALDLVGVAYRLDRYDTLLSLGMAMRRRDFIKVIGGGASAWSLAARAQQPAMPVVGFLSSRAPGESANVLAAFREGLREAGFVEGKNDVIE